MLRPVLKALEKGRVQPMYAKVREHGAPVQGARLGEEAEKAEGEANRPGGYQASSRLSLA